MAGDLMRIAQQVERLRSDIATLETLRGDSTELSGLSAEEAEPYFRARVLALAEQNWLRLEDLPHLAIDQEFTDRYGPLSLIGAFWRRLSFDITTPDARIVLATLGGDLLLVRLPSGCVYCDDFQNDGHWDGCSRLHTRNVRTDWRTRWKGAPRLRATIEPFTLAGLDPDRAGAAEKMLILISNVDQAYSLWLAREQRRISDRVEACSRLHQICCAGQ